MRESEYGTSFFLVKDFKFFQKSFDAGKNDLCTYTENNDQKYSYRETSNIMFEYTIDNLNGRISGPGQMAEADENIHIIRPSVYIVLGAAQPIYDS